MGGGALPPPLEKRAKGGNTKLIETKTKVERHMLTRD
jgi:hypothetical protein